MSVYTLNADHMLNAKVKNLANPVFADERVATRTRIPVQQDVEIEFVVFEEDVIREFASGEMIAEIVTVEFDHKESEIFVKSFDFEAPHDGIVTMSVEAFINTNHADLIQYLTRSAQMKRTINMIKNSGITVKQATESISKIGKAMNEGIVSVNELREILQAHEDQQTAIDEPSERRIQL